MLFAVSRSNPRSRASFARSSGSVDPAKAPAPAPGGGLAFLKTFDANVQAKVGNLTFKDVEIEGVALDATLQNGTLTVRDASVADLAGGQAKLAGTIAGLGNKPSVDGSFDVRTKDPVRLLRLAGVTPPDAAARLGSVEFQGKAKGALDATSGGPAGGGSGRR